MTDSLPLFFTVFLPAILSHNEKNSQCYNHMIMKSDT